MDVVSSEARSTLHSELLYADGLVIMAPSMKQLGRRVAEWRASLLDRGLKVNAGKSKVRVRSSGRRMIANWLQKTQHTRGGAVAVVWHTTCKLCLPFSPPQMGARLPFFSKSAIYTRWMAGNAPHKSGICQD